MNDKITISASSNSHLIKMGIVQGGSGALPYYTGDYEITPKAGIEQTLETKRKSMKEDVVVKEIPYSETSNLFGTTVNIGF